MPRFWNMKAANGVGQIDIMGDIVFGKWDKWAEDDVAASEFKEELDALGDVKTLQVSVNSYGGDVFAGQAIHTMLMNHPATVEMTVLGIAASIASVIVSAGDLVMMPSNSMLMVHNPWSVAIGNAAYMRKVADDLDTIRESIIAAYQRKLGDNMTRDEIIALMDGETWLTAQEAYNMGFADVVTDELAVAASASDLVPTFRNTPAGLKAAPATGVEPPETVSAEERARIVAEAEASTNTVQATLKDLSFSPSVE